MTEVEDFERVTQRPVQQGDLSEKVLIYVPVWVEYQAFKRLEDDIYCFDLTDLKPLELYTRFNRLWNYLYDTFFDFLNEGWKY